MPSNPYTLNNKFNKFTQDHQDYHLNENNVMFNLFLINSFMVYIQIHKLELFYHNYN